MILSHKQSKIIEKALLICALILAFEFSFPHQLQAKEIDGSQNLGPVLVRIAAAQTINGEPTNNLTGVENRKPKITRWITVTAYSSTPDQTDDSPFITANGKYVYDGLIAANFLPFGTEVKLPDYFGDKIFTVNDRMNAKYYYHLDVWMPTREAAKEFGVKYLKVEIY